MLVSLAVIFLSITVEILKWNVFVTSQNWFQLRLQKFYLITQSNLKSIAQTISEISLLVWCLWRVISSGELLRVAHTYLSVLMTNDWGCFTAPLKSLNSESKNHSSSFIQTDKLGNSCWNVSNCFKGKINQQASRLLTDSITWTTWICIRSFLRMFRLILWQSKMFDWHCLINVYFETFEIPANSWSFQKAFSVG